MPSLYGVARSRASRPLWLLAEIGLPFDHIAVIQAYRLPDAFAADAPENTASPSFLAINPMGQIPAYRDGDLILTESLAICQHIARKHGGTLGAGNLEEAALIDQWMLFAATNIEEPALDMMFTIADGKTKTPDDAAKIAACVEKLNRPLAHLETYLTSHDWLVGNRFTVADIMAAEILRYAQINTALMEAHPRASAWLKKCQARPAFQVMWSARLAEPA